MAKMRSRSIVGVQKLLGTGEVLLEAIKLGVQGACISRSKKSEVKEGRGRN
jgi:hypothetical protein